MQAPPAGAVTANVGVIAYDGDRGTGVYDGDVLKLNGTALSDALHPADDAFDSAIADLGVRETGRNPSHANTLGFDGSVFAANGRIANGATSASIALTTGGETYFPGVVTSAIDLYAPRVEVSTSVTDLSGGDVTPGDTLEYRIQVTNRGDDNATGVVVDDAIPANTTYVPGTLAITAGTGQGALSDATGDDRGDLSGGAVHVRLGTGATSAADGTLGVGATATVTFRVMVDSVIADGVAIANQAEVPHTAAILGTTLLARSATVTSTVVAPPDAAPDPTPPPPDPVSQTPDPSPVPDPAPPIGQTPAPLPSGPPSTTPLPVEEPATPAPVAAPAPVVTLAVVGPKRLGRGQTGCSRVTVRSLGRSAARVQTTLPVPAGTVVKRIPRTARLVRAVIVGPPLTLTRGARSVLPACLTG